MYVLKWSRVEWTLFIRGLLSLDHQNHANHSQEIYLVDLSHDSRAKKLSSHISAAHFVDDHPIIPLTLRESIVKAINNKETQKRMIIVWKDEEDKAENFEKLAKCIPEEVELVLVEKRVDEERLDASFLALSLPDLMKERNAAVVGTFQVADRVWVSDGGALPFETDLVFECNDFERFVLSRPKDDFFPPQTIFYRERKFPSIEDQTLLITGPGRFYCWIKFQFIVNRWKLDERLRFLLSLETLVPMSVTGNEENDFIDSSIAGGLLPSKIMDRLYLGGIDHALSSTILDHYNITHVATIGPVKDVKGKHSDLQTLRIAINDNGVSSLYEHFPAIVDFVHSAIQSNGNVLVHCHVGQSRSPSAVIAYLMKSKLWTVKQAYCFVKRQRHQIAPMLNFVKDLMRWEDALFERTSLLMTRETDFIE
ncbi:protein-tyrosine phosphatase-like protein [Cladochytrium replicatum]|nr:protein-tyrosine phosphatase-like protein [Cladochytrium replicatum]